jgi:FkbM family methyltransferase
METTKVRHCGYDINCRVFAPWLDLNIITKLIGDDEYGLMDFNQVASDVNTIFDIGGHIGGFGLVAKRLWPNARLIAIEPHPVNHELYIKNLKDNGLYDNCEIIRGAVGYNKEATCLVHAPSTTGGDILKTKKEAQKYIDSGYRFYNGIDDENVRVYTIEELTSGIDRIDLAKWDCEGGEIDCFKNISKECASKFRYMLGEYHIWKEGSLYLKADKVDSIKFWNLVKRKFPHLYFTYKHNTLGLFQAWPKGLQ